MAVRAMSGRFGVLCSACEEPDVRLLCFGRGLCGAGVGVSSLTNEQAAGGLKEALTQGITTAVAETGKPGGFENNPLIKIAMPEKLRGVEKGLRAMGMGAQVDGFEHSMNAAAEEAAPRAKAIFIDALKSMTIEDAQGIVLGGNTAGTEFFKRKTSTQVSEAFRPVIEKAMAHTGVQEKFGALMGSAPKLPFGQDAARWTSTAMCWGRAWTGCSR